MQDIIQDKELSWKAKGLYAAIAARVEEGEFTQMDLSKMSTDGASSVSSGVKELVDRGYLSRKRARTNGRLDGSIWSIKENITKDRLSRAQMRAKVHMVQCQAFRTLIENIKPDWFEQRENRLCYADDKECPLQAIEEMFEKTNKAWSNLEDWEKVLDEAAQDTRLTSLKNKKKV